jgi:hypothetical protein
MSQSSLIKVGSGQLGCESSAGTYYLSRTYFNVKIASAAPDSYYLSSVNIVRGVDGDHGFCLDYLGSITAEEAFVVNKTPDGLLTQITSNSADKSAEIVKTLLQAFFVGISGKADFPAATRATVGAQVAENRVVDQTYDPYNEADTALLNNSIKDYGFCLVMEDQVFNAGYKDVQDYCDDPLRHTPIEKELIRVGKPKGPEPSVFDDHQGIYYRPRRTRTVYLFIKPDLRRKGGWKLRASQAVALENTSPMMFIGIDRTFFAERKTTVLFDQGVLTDVRIEKKSELVGFVSIPLYIAQSIVNLPAQIVQVRIDTTNKRAQLIRAKADLIKAETDLLTLQKSLAESNGQGNGQNNGAGPLANIERGQGTRVLASVDDIEAYCRERERAGENFQRCMNPLPACQQRFQVYADIFSCVTRGGPH